MYSWDRLLVWLGLLIASWAAFYGICWLIYKGLQALNHYLDSIVINF